jgi:hypothetical protein
MVEGRKTMLEAMSAVSASCVSSALCDGELSAGRAAISHLEIECPSCWIPCGRGQSFNTLQGDARGRRLCPAPRRRVGRGSNSRGQEAADLGAWFACLITDECVCQREAWMVFERL